MDLNRGQVQGQKPNSTGGALMEGRSLQKIA